MDLGKILVRSDELEELIVELLEVGPAEDSERYFACHVMCSVAVEHANSFRTLIKSENFTSAISLCRLQFETLVRAIWIFYAATDGAISKITSIPTLESEKSTNNIPMLSEMLIKLRGKAPDMAVDMLEEFKHYSWKSLSSFVHGGNHAISRHVIGHSDDLIDQVIRMSNALNTMAGMMLVILIGDEHLAGLFSRIQREFEDCLPELKYDVG